MGKKKRQQQEELFWANAKEVPTKESVSAPASATGAKWLRRGVKLSVFLTPVLIVMLVIALGKSSTQAVTPASDVDLSTPGRAVARLAVNDWLDSSPAPLPGGELLSWSGENTLDAPKSDSAKSSDDSVFATKQESFTVVDATGQLYRASVLVSVDPDGAATVIGTPGITPVPDVREDGVQKFAAWGTLVKRSLPDPAVASVKDWARAFGSGNPDGLRLTVGDQNSGHAYLPLYDMTLDSVRVDKAAVITQEKESPMPSSMIARVELSMSRGYTPGDDNRSQQLPVFTYDVLIVDTDTATPRVVAWGGAGTGPELTKYQNAHPSDIPFPKSGEAYKVAAADGITETVAPTTATSTETVVVTDMTTVTHTATGEHAAPTTGASNPVTPSAESTPAVTTRTTPNTNDQGNQ